MDKMNIGLDEEKRKQICDVLSNILANSYAIYLKTQSFHWNVKGKEFYALHLMFQSQYEEFAEAIDEIAERIHSLGFYPEGSFSAFAKLAIIKRRESKNASP